MSKTLAVVALLSITASSLKGHYRAGMFWPMEPTTRDVTPEQFEVLKGDPWLKIHDESELGQKSLQDRLAELAEQEAVLSQKEQDLVARESALAEREATLLATQKSLEDGQKDLKADRKAFEKEKAEFEKAKKAEPAST